MPKPDDFGINDLVDKLEETPPETPEERDDRITAKIACIENLANRASAILRYGEAKWQEGYEASAKDAIAEIEEEPPEQPIAIIE